MRESLYVKQLFDYNCYGGATILIYDLRIHLSYELLQQLSVTMDVLYNVYVWHFLSFGRGSPAPSSRAPKGPRTPVWEILSYRFEIKETIRSASQTLQLAIEFTCFFVVWA